MKPEALCIYICPDCGCEKLELDGSSVNNSQDVVLEGAICCPECQRTFPVIRGIPRFVPVENYSRSFAYQWNLHRKTQLDSYTGLPISRERLFEVTGWSPEELSGTTVLEAGSGAGRFTEVLLEAGAKVVSFDYSSAVDVNNENQNQNPNLTLFQGDILKIPLRKRAYSKVICLGVLQHTSDPQEAFKSLSSMVAPGGEIVIDVYKKCLSASFQWKYLLRPLTRRLNEKLLYKGISLLVPVLLPLAIMLRKIAGRAGGRLIPICDYSNLGLTYNLNKEWSILDTFDMYSPAYDSPQSKETVMRWFIDAGFEEIKVGYGKNGIVGKGKYPSGTD